MSDKEGKVNKEVYDIAVTQSSKLGDQVRLLDGQRKGSNRKLDAARRVVQIGTLVTIVILVIVIFTNHPAIDGVYTKQKIGILIAICAGYAVALEVARGNFGILLFLMQSGTAAFSFGLGYGVSQFQK